MNNLQDNLHLIIYQDDDGRERKTYSEYIISNNTITFFTQNNKITIPISKLIKIKEVKVANGWRK